MNWQCLLIRVIFIFSYLKFPHRQNEDQNDLKLIILRKIHIADYTTTLLSPFTNDEAEAQKGQLSWWSYRVCNSWDFNINLFFLFFNDLELTSFYFCFIQRITDFQLHAIPWDCTVFLFLWILLAMGYSECLMVLRIFELREAHILL